MALFGGDGPAFLTESLRSTSSHGEEKPTPTKGLGSGLFDDAGGEEEEEERGELFESTVR